MEEQEPRVGVRMGWLACARLGPGYGGSRTREPRMPLWFFRGEVSACYVGSILYTRPCDSRVKGWRNGEMASMLRSKMAAVFLNIE